MTLKDKIKPPKVDLSGERYCFPERDHHRGYNHALDDAQKLIDDNYAKHIEPLFANAVEVTGNVEFDVWHQEPRDPKDDASYSRTHRALIIGIEPIQKGVSVEEIVDFFKSINGRMEENAMDQYLTRLIDRIEKEGVRNV